MGNTAADVLVEGIIAWGVDTVFGLPGDGINGIMEALRQRQDRVRFIQVRHEEAAALMACAYAKYTGRLGCCLATSGPGGIHLLNGLYDAKMDQAPVLAITGQTYSDLKGSKFQQEVNMTLLFEDVTVYNQEVINPNQVAMLADEACRHALNHRGVAHITFPVDYQEKEPTGKGTMHKVEGHTTSRWAPAVVIPPEEELKRAASILNEAKKPIILVGQGALSARSEVIELADKLGAPIVKALLGKAVVPDDHPLTTGGLGLLGTTPSQQAMEEADALLIIGSSFPYMEYLPKPDQARGVQIDDKPDRIGLRFPVEVGLVGDAKPTVAALSRFVERKEDRKFLEQAQKGMQEWRELMRTRALKDDVPIKPQRVAWELSELAADDAIISTDSGTITTWIARQFRIRGTQKFSCSGTLATMAGGLPYSIAAKIAFPERQSIAFVGDGGFAMLMMEFLTAVKYKLPIVVVIIKNNTLGQIKWEQIVFLGNPEYGCELHNPDFAKYAEACGGLGFTVERPEEIRPTLEHALNSNKPSLVEVVVDPYEPPMPPKVTVKQALHFAEALAKGEPHGGRIALTLFRDKLNELL
ncbi:MAG: thiamine pyrophosphate-binding protein [Deltaproteobacteria bacterium]|nr:thiamine pyrophosphate-binding protein [Deltaproteobacteria bacterium]MDZ4342829.1 thiamine pyrophosphate-binding protein [Candidatus Binatia bacterium]